MTRGPEPQTLTRLAPAKVNLYLRVLGRRPDCYHEVDTLLVPLELGDEVSVTVSPASCQEGGCGAVECHCPDAPHLEGPENLGHRAARLFLESTRKVARVQIVIRKRIWEGAGLGGGASDAAAVLLALDELLATRFPKKWLRALARELGADVPFFIEPRPSRGQGIGDELTAVGAVPALDLVLVNPRSRLRARDVYAALALEPGTPWCPRGSGEREAPSPVLSLPPGPAALDVLRDEICNDLECVTAKLEPAVCQARELLMQSGAIAAAVCGSGPTVFGVYPDVASARDAMANISKLSGFLAVATRSVAA